MYDTPTPGQCKRASLSLENSSMTSVSTPSPSMQLSRLLFKHTTEQQCSRPNLSTAEQSGERSHSPGTSQVEKKIPLARLQHTCLLFKHCLLCWCESFFLPAIGEKERERGLETKCVFLPEVIINHGVACSAAM